LPVLRNGRTSIGSSGPVRSGADLVSDHFRRFTLILPSGLAQTNILGSIHGQKEEVRDVVRRLRLVGDAPSLQAV